MKDIILFEESAKRDILDFFDKSVDEEGFIVEKNNPTQRVLSMDGDWIEINSFAGLRKGSMIFIKGDLISLIDLADRVK
ncbi:hypothetical protein ES705_06483 [subsurface metagenome]|nr:hypothetical protein [Clostridia bacterium]